MQILWNENCCPKGLRADPDLTFDSFAVVRCLGSGSLSQVLYCVHKASQTPVALKIYAKDKLSELSKRQIIRELEIHITLSHPSILGCYGAFESGDSLYLMLEYAEGGDLFAELKRKGGKMTERTAVNRVLYPIMSALDYLHSNEIMHRDLKPENLVVTENGNVKLCDFGLSINVSSERPVTRLGTLEFMSPEILRCPKKRLPEENKDKEYLWYNKAADCWAVGVLAVELLTGRSPFEGKNREDTAARVSSAIYTLPATLSQGAVSFVQSILKVNPDDRPPMRDLIGHPWIQAHLDTASGSGSEQRDAMRRSNFSHTAQHSIKARISPSNSLNPVGRLMSMPNVGSQVSSASMDALLAAHQAGATPAAVPGVPTGYVPRALAAEQPPAQEASSAAPHQMPPISQSQSFTLGARRPVARPKASSNALDLQIQRSGFSNMSLRPAPQPSADAAAPQLQDPTALHPSRHRMATVSNPAAPKPLYAPHVASGAKPPSLSREGSVNLAPSGTSTPPLHRYNTVGAYPDPSLLLGSDRSLATILGTPPKASYSPGTSDRDTSSPVPPAGNLSERKATRARSRVSHLAPNGSLLHEPMGQSSPAKGSLPVVLPSGPSSTSANGQSHGAYAPAPLYRTNSATGYPAFVQRESQSGQSGMGNYEQRPSLVGNLFKKMVSPF